MSITLAVVKEALRLASIEIYRTQEAEVQIAERIRYHIMDSGVRILIGRALKIVFSARAQKSDFPHGLPDALYMRIRENIGKDASTRGYQETETRTVNVTDPVDSSKMLDVWYEVLFEKEVSDISAVIDEVKWAVSLDKVAS
jgi:hypothetical protein